MSDHRTPKEIIGEAAHAQGKAERPLRAIDGGAEGGPAPAPDEVGDILLADRFIAEHGDDLMHVPGLDWLSWDGAVWKRCELGEQIEMAKTTARRARLDPSVDKATSKAVMQEPRVKGALRLSAVDPKVAVHPDALDRDGFLLATPGGTVDLRTGRVHEARREDLITRQTSVAVADSVGPKWAAFIERAQPDPERRIFLQTLTGMAAVAGESGRHLPIFLGEGANGKSQFVIAVGTVLGDYAHAAPMDLLISDSRRSKSQSPEIAALRGRRFVSVSETPEDGRLSSERVKALTGGEPMTGKFLYANPITFRPTHTVFLSTNHLPRVADAGPAIWDRLLLVGWPTSVPEEEQVLDLGEKLAKAEGPGILRWIVEGAVRYLRDGLQVPSDVRAATQTYRAGEDVFGAFLEERTEELPQVSVGASQLLSAYREWTKSRPSAPPLSDATLKERMAAKGFEHTKRSRRAFYIGLRLVEPDSDDGGEW